MLTSCATKQTVIPLTAVEAEETVITELSAFRSNDYVVVTLEADNPLTYSAFKLEEPRRIVVDINKVEFGDYLDPIKLDDELVEFITPLTFKTTGGSRVEIQLKDEAQFLVNSRDSNRFTVVISALDGKSPSLYEPLIVEEKGLGFDSLAATAAGGGKEESQGTEEELIIEKYKNQTILTNITFQQIGKVGRVIVTTDRDNPKFKLIKRNNIKRYSIDFPNSVITKSQEKLINVNLENSNVENVIAFQHTTGRRPIAKVLINIEKIELYHLYSKDNKVYFDIGEEAALALASEVPNDEFLKTDDTPLIDDEQNFEGIPISLDFQRAEIQNILRILADVSGVNIITSESVRGTVTMKLNNVPWDQALDVILRNNGLDMIRNGGIIRVATREEVQKEKEATERLLETDKKISPLVTQVITVNFEAAESMKENLQTLKSARGSVDVNTRTNSLIIKDTRARIVEMIKLINKLDQEEKQVQIESRIVEITRDNDKGIGVQWGGAYTQRVDSAFPHTVGLFGGISSGGPNQGLGGLGIDTSSSLSIAPTGSLGLTLGHINGTALLDAKILAMEKRGEGKTISKPKITTLNNQSAVIESGSEVPYQTVSSEGTRTQFKKATLRLEVLPHITPNGLVRMSITATKDEPDFSQVTNAGPPIKTKNAQTEVIVKDGDTVVLGGLFTNKKTLAISRVPYLSDIPILGLLFKGRTTRVEINELLIFITPKVLGRSLSEGDIL